MAGGSTEARSSSASRPDGRWAFAARLALPLAVLVMGLAARLAAWQEVFGARGMHLRGDTDPLYHVLRAERLVAGAPWRDPALDWPAGADVPWPPLFDAAIAAGARMMAAQPTRDDFVRSAALLPVLLGLAALPLVAALGRRLLGDRLLGWGAAALAALIPAVERFSEVGRADQHAAELLLFPAILLTFLVAAQEPRGARWAGLATAVLAAVAFWTWMGSAVLLVGPVAFSLAWHVLAPAGDEVAKRCASALAAAGWGGAALLALSVALFGPAGALTSAAPTGVGGLHVAILAGVGAVGGALAAVNHWSASDRPRWRRTLEAAAALALPMGAALGLAPSLRSGAVRGLTALLASNAWYASIGEFEPLFPMDHPIGDELLDALSLLGLLLPAALLAIPTLRERWRHAEERPAVAFLVVLLTLFVPAMLLRQRFMGYAALPLGLAAVAGIAWVAGRIASRRPRAECLRAAALGIGVLIVAAPSLPRLGASMPPVSSATEAALRWLASVPVRPGSEGVISNWGLGHAVQYYAGRPVIATPFGTEGGEGAMEAWGRFLGARDGASAEVVLAERRVGWVVLTNPSDELAVLLAYAPPGTPPALVVERDLWTGVRSRYTPEGMWFVPARLYRADGRALPNGAPALDGFRLIYEGPRTAADFSGAERQIKIFEVVAGARLALGGLPPASSVRASVRLRTNQGREVPVQLAVAAGADGVARLRLPYATGWNGAVLAMGWQVEAGDRYLTVSVTDEDVLLGRSLDP